MVPYKPDPNIVTDESSNVPVPQGAKPPAGTVFTLKFNTFRPKKDGHHFPDDIFKCIFLNDNLPVSIKISLKFAPKGPINIIPALIQIMAWRRPGDKPLSESMLI